MRYFATPSNERIVDLMADGTLGMIDTPYQGGKHVAAAHARGAEWCADNGAFTDRWDEDTWWSWLTSPEKLAHVDRCAFATAPDVVGDAVATEAKSRPWLARIRELGYPVAYVAQDGMEHSTWDLWDEIDCLFLGGTDLFKLGPEAANLVAVASSLGKWVHMGRVNSQRRFTYARTIGCDSADGTILKHGPDVNLIRVRSWLRSSGQQDLFGVGLT